MFKGFIRTGSFGLIPLLMTIVLGTLFIPVAAIGKGKENSTDNPSVEARRLTQELIALRGIFLTLPNRCHRNKKCSENDRH